MKSKKSFIALVLCMCMLIGALPITANGLKAAPKVSIKTVSGMMGDRYDLVLGEDSAYAKAITEISVDGKVLENKGANQSTAAYYSIKDNAIVGYSKYGLNALLGKEFRITATGYETLVFKVVKQGEAYEIEQEESQGSEPIPDTPQPSEDDLKKVPKFSAGYHSSFSESHLRIKFEDANDYVKGITSVSVNGTEWAKVSKAALFGSGRYYISEADATLLFDGATPFPLKKNDVLTIKSTGYEDLELVVDVKDKQFSVAVKGEENPNQTDEKLHVRLVGAFEHAMVGQEKYDAISGATGSITSNKNSNVELQAAVVAQGVTPTDDDWKNITKIDGLRLDNKSKIKISPENSGMTPLYGTIIGEVTLKGIPENAGEYKIYADVYDTFGRHAISNELIFEVFDANQKLVDRLQLKYAEKFENNDYYKYDMKPWDIVEFGGTDETVTMPKEIGVWYGSHTSGTYGYLGKAIEGLENSLPTPTQTLIIPSGATVTLVNMQPRSSVRIVVEDGAKLSLDNSSIHGIIEVNKGGVFSMNYDAHAGKFKTGSSINGQLILNDGAKIENAMVYSNTNFLSNGKQVRKNTNPVVVMRGKVDVVGNVFIKGDEAATGCGGQPALEISNGEAVLDENATLAVYGGGNKATTSEGGDGLKLDNGKVSGKGTLIAMGGSGFFGSKDHGKGGDAVSGKGEITTRRAWLEGGAVIKPFNNDVERKGKAKTENIEISPETNAVLKDGEVVLDTVGGPSEDYWTDITKPPVLVNFVFPDKYSIDIEQCEGGTVKVTPETAFSGEKVVVEVTANAGYKLEELLMIASGEQDKTIDISTDQISFEMPAMNITLKPKFTKLEYNIVSKDDNIKCENESTSENGSEIKAVIGDIIKVILSDKTGYELKNLYYKAGEKQTEIKDNKFTMIAENLEVYAEFDAIEYKITYTLDGGEKDDQSTYTVEQLPMKITSPVRKGYRFLGWSTADDKTVKKDVEIAEGTTGDLAFIANWKKIQFVNEADEPKKPERKDIEHNGDAAVPTYEIRIAKNVDKGMVILEDTSAQAGATVYFKVTSDDVVAAAKILGDRNIPISYLGNNSYSFVMPSDDVEIFAERIKKIDYTKMNFADVKITDWFYKPVGFVFDRKLISGVDSANFAPDMKATRGMLVTILYRMEGMPIAFNSSFSDVKGNEYYANAVNWAANEKIVAGYADGRFGANDALTREQLVSILMRYMKYKGYDTLVAKSVAHFSDVADMSDYAADAMKWAYAEGIINGTPAGRLEPKSGATRAQLAAMLMNMYTNIIEK